MSFMINSTKQKRNEDEIINFISNSSLKDRSLLLLYISKLSSNGLYIPSISSLINFCEEIIILKDTIETQNEDLVAKWYWADDDMGGHQTDYKPYSFETCKRLEKAKKNKIEYCRISDVHFVDTISLAQIRYDDKGRVRLVKRDPPKYKENEILPQQQQPITTENNNNNNDNNNKDDEFIQWYWADDGPRGHQDVWVKYSEDLSKLMEASYQNNNKINSELIPIKVDEERFVDTKRMLQVRFDSRFRVRLVKRDTKALAPPPKGSSGSGSGSGSSSAPSTPSKSTMEKLFGLMTLQSPKKSTPKKTNQKIPFVDTSINLKTLPNDELLDILTIDEIKYLMKKLVIAIPDSSKSNADQASTNSSLKNFTISTFKSTFILNNNQILSKIVLKK
ncbi:hypothetical protein ACTFIW_004908 [Dictyostelium discoideum]